MAVFKCKMCGGTIEFTTGDTVGVCDSCGTKQTLPKSNDDVIANLFNRANNLRLKCEFDKAEAIYEKIVEQDDSEAEAHWGIVLCKYGIEYVDDPLTGEKVPTCHRTMFEAVTTDADYQAAIDYSDPAQQIIYEKEAHNIDHIQRDILSIVEKEEPFDIFICYKETDENGKRTVDSTIANEIYYQLKEEGFKVFYAAITLEDKLGHEYEPYIFAALNSAKVMLLIGTKPEYFNAVWVKNEWSRFIKFTKNDRSKMLIPCYRDFDPYDLPEEFAHLQAQDMGKIGFINDVVRGIKKVINKDISEQPLVVNTVVTEKNSNIEPLLKRVSLFLEDGDFDKADEFCEKVLNKDPECAEAYIDKLLIEFKCHTRDELSEQPIEISNSKNYNKVIRFGNEYEKNFVIEANKKINSLQKQLLENEENDEQSDDLTFDDDYNIDDETFIDVYCPNCGEVLSYTEKQLKSKQLLCPYCDETFHFNNKMLKQPL
ncbi:MAG: toll/interleukin-1 receptor domain-containing protein [Lachnospiraceae bacterium]|nr:toll/interleukin-1 receptor domain-containing protein [Lachnospiraceae bacterium]